MRGKRTSTCPVPRVTCRAELMVLVSISRAAKVRQPAILLAVLILATMRIHAQSTGILQDLGTVGGDSYSSAYDVSADGNVVVGSSTFPFTSGWRWTLEGGMQSLGPAPGYGAIPRSISADGDVVSGEGNYWYFGNPYAFLWTKTSGVQDLVGAGLPDELSVFGALSADGSTIVGRVLGPNQLFRWTVTGGLQMIEAIYDLSWANAMGVSADGSVIVGTLTYHDTQPPNQAYTTAYRWTAAGGMQDIVPLGGKNAQAWAVSADGSVVVGSSHSSNGSGHAFRWTQADGMQDLGVLLGGNSSVATAVSADGGVVVGQSTYSTSYYTHAFRWTQADGIQDLGTLGGGTSTPYAVSADGSVVVGASQVGPFSYSPQHAFRWTAATGMQDLWALGGSGSIARAVSADGSVVVGDALLPGNVSSHAVRWLPSGHVVLGAHRVPLTRIRISIAQPGSSLWFNPTSGAPQQLLCTNNDSTETRTGNAGGYWLPSTLPPGNYRIRAEMCFKDPGTGETIGVFQYPEHDPNKTWKIGPGAEAIPDIVFPSPVLLQCGFLDDYSGLDAYFDFLTADPAQNAIKADLKIPAFICARMPSSAEEQYGYLNKATKVSEYDENAKLLAFLASYVKLNLITPGYFSDDGADKISFSLLGHSMGGVIARALASHPGNLQFYRVVTLDAPHGGTAPAGLFGIAKAMSYAAMNGQADFFNQPPSIPGWNQTHTVGPSPNTWLTYSCSNLCDRVVSPDSSAYGYGEPVIVGTKTFNGHPQWSCIGTQIEVNNKHSNLSPFFFCPNLKTDPDVIRDVAVFLASGMKPPSNRASPAYAGSTPLPPYTVGGLIGAAAGGDSTEFPFAEGGAFVNGAVLVAGTGAQYTITSPQGIPLSVLNLEHMTLGPDGYLDTFQIESTPNGPIAIKLSAGEEAAKLSFSLDMLAPYEATGSISPPIAPRGTSVQLLGQLIDSASVTVVSMLPRLTAIVTDTDGVEHVVSLADNGQSGDGAAGDGLFGGQFLGTSTAGRYSVEFHTIGTVAGQKLERTSWREFAIAPDGASFAGTIAEAVVDTDENGLLDRIDFSIPVSYSLNGSYLVTANVRDWSGSVLVPLSATIELSGAPLEAVAKLSVDGVELVKWGQAAPWLLTDISLVSIDAGSLPCATLPDYVTAAYPLEGFEQPLPPSILQILPASGPIEGGDAIQILGTSLDTAVDVRVDGVSVSFTITGENSILITMPPGLTVQANGQPKAGPGKGVRVTKPVNASIEVETPWGIEKKKQAYAYVP